MLDAIPPREPNHEIQRFGSGDPCADLLLCSRPTSPILAISHQFSFYFFFLRGGKGCDGRYSPLSLMSFASLVGELHNLFLGQCGFKPM